MSLMRSNAVVEQLLGSYPEEAVLDQLGWLYEEQIRRVCEEIFALLPGYRQKVDEATYAHEKEHFLMLLDLAHEDGLSVPELEAVLKRLNEHRQVFAVATRQGGHDEPPVPVHAPADTGVSMTQVESEHRVYQSSLTELLERLEKLTFAGETHVDLDGVIYSVAFGADSQGESCVLQAQS